MMKAYLEIFEIMNSIYSATRADEKKCNQCKEGTTNSLLVKIIMIIPHTVKEQDPARIMRIILLFKSGRGIITLSEQVKPGRNLRIFCLVSHRSTFATYPTQIL